MPEPLIDEVEVIRLLGAPFAISGDTALRDAIEIIVNGQRLSEILGGLPLDESVARTLIDAWVWGGGGVTIGCCRCGAAGCIPDKADITRRGSIVEWVLQSEGRVFRFDGADLNRQLRRVLDE